MPSIFEKKDLARQLRKQQGKSRKKNGADPTNVKDLGQASRKASQQPTYKFPRPARNVCDTYGQHISKRYYQSSKSSLHRPLSRNKSSS